MGGARCSWRASRNKREREDEHHVRLAYAMLAARRARCAERRPRTSNWCQQEDSRRAGVAARHRLALACPYPRGLGWGEVRRSGRGAGMFPGWPGARASAAGLVFPFVLAAASGAAMIAAGATARKSRIPSGPCMTGAAAAVILAGP